MCFKIWLLSSSAILAGQMKASASLDKSGLTRSCLFLQLVRNQLDLLVHMVNNGYLKKSFSGMFLELTCLSSRFCCCAGYHLAVFAGRDKELREVTNIVWGDFAL